MKQRRNVTLSLPESLLRRFRVYAATRDESMSHLMVEALRALLDQDQQTAKSKRRFIERIRNAPDRGTGGTIHWTRDELHEH